MDAKSDTNTFNKEDTNTFNKDDENNSPRDEIIYYLRFLNFIRPKDLNNEAYERLTYFINNIDCYTGQLVEYTPENVIEEVANKMVVVALMRNIKNVIVKNNTLLYNKKVYKFNNVYTNEEYENLINQTVDFTNKRLNANKNTSIVYHGYSASGKSTLLDRVLENYQHCKRFKLYEVYLNKIFVYFNGFKVEIKDIDDDKYVFESSNIRNIMTMFARKSSNGVNSTSSRSHTILELVFDKCKLTCIDLCGNEKAINKEQHDETVFINKSLYNVSRYLSLGNKYKEKGCALLNIIKKTQNILMTVIFNDNGVNLAVNHLLLLKDFLKSII